MTLVGKIFTLIILLLSFSMLLTATTIFATHRNWRDTALANKKKIEEVGATNALLREEMQRREDRLAIEQASRRYALASLQTKLEQIEQALSAREASYTSLQFDAGKRATELEATNVRLNATMLANETLRTNLRDAQQNRDAQFASVIDLTEKVHDLEGTRQTLAETNSQIIAQVSKLKDIVTRLEIDVDAPLDGRPLPVDGLVTAVSEKDLLEVSIGWDDGLREGYMLEVFRAGQYLGRVRVEKTWPDRAVVRIIPEYRNGIIKKGDRVATKLG